MFFFFFATTSLMNKDLYKSSNIGILWVWGGVAPAHAYATTTKYAVRKRCSGASHVAKRAYRQMILATVNQHRCGRTLVEFAV